MKAGSAGIHPLLALAAVAVIVFSIAGVAAIFGRIPGAESKSGEVSTQSAVDSNTQNAFASKSGAVQRTASARRSASPALAAAPAPCADCGVIESIRTVQVAGNTSGLGAAAGGVTGAVLGNQIGRGNGRTIATIAGAAGGAYAGNAIEKNMNKRTAYRVTLRMDDGSQRSLTQSEAPAYPVGERVRIANGRIADRA